MSVFKIDNYVNYNLSYYKEENPYFRAFSVQIEYLSNISIKALESFLNRLVEYNFKSDIIKWLDKKFDILQYGRVENFEFEVYQNGKYIVVEIKF